MRTPAEHRAEVAAVMAKVPKRDCDIIPRGPRSTEAPRHRDLSDRLALLLEWRRLANPEEIWPSCWCVPANDNGAEAAHVEAEWEMRPSLSEIERTLEQAREDSVEDGGAEAIMRLYRKDAYGTPYGSREDRQAAIDALKYLLRYMQGTPVVSPERHDPNFAPTGLGAPESPSRTALRDLADSFGVGRDVPFAEARARWNLPPVANDNEPTFPWRPSDPREIFSTGRVHSNPEASRGGEFNDGISRRLGDLQEAAHLRGKLPAETVRVLDVAILAQSFADVGRAFGVLEKKSAARRGKQLVVDACEKLSAELEKIR